MPHECDYSCDHSLKMIIVAIIVIFVGFGPVFYAFDNYLLHNSTIAAYTFGSNVVIVDDMESRYGEMIDSSNVYDIIDIYSRYTPADYVDYCGANYSELTDAEWYCLRLLARDHVVTLHGLKAAGIPEEILQTKL